jgi:hypothetical protein
MTMEAYALKYSAFRKLLSNLSTVVERDLIRINPGQVAGIINMNEELRKPGDQERPRTKDE